MNTENYDITSPKAHLEPIAVTTAKIWDDADNRNGKRPTSITLTLSGAYTVGGVDKACPLQTPRATIIPTGEGWPSHTWQNLPKYWEGQPVTHRDGDRH